MTIIAIINALYNVSVYLGLHDYKVISLADIILFDDSDSNTFIMKTRVLWVETEYFEMFDRMNEIVV